MGKFGAMRGNLETEMENYVRGIQIRMVITDEVSLWKSDEYHTPRVSLS